MAADSIHPTVVLAIDAGNTRIKWGAHDGRSWLVQGALPTVAEAGLASQWPPLPPGARAIASNVAGADVAQRLERACREARLDLHIIRPEPAQLGVTNGYADGSQLGADRWAALIAAHHAHAGHKLVVNAGTALTIDALASDGRFLGGLIVPGPALMRRSLDRGTAGLRLTEGAFSALPRSTPDAITSGAIQACVGAVERLRAAMAAQEFAPVLTLLSGGAAPELMAHLPLPVALDENLVLEGLVLIARSREAPGRP